MKLTGSHQGPGPILCDPVRVVDSKVPTPHTGAPSGRILAVSSKMNPILLLPSRVSGSQCYASLGPWAARKGATPHLDLEHPRARCLPQGMARVWTHKIVTLFRSKMLA
eukprot:1157524-Pelagomonas_calceolata.AAC.4